MRFHEGRGMECSEKKDKLTEVYDEAQAYREYKRSDKESRMRPEHKEG